MGKAANSTGWNTTGPLKIALGFFFIPVPGPAASNALSCAV